MDSEQAFEYIGTTGRTREWKTGEVYEQRKKKKLKYIDK